MLATEISPFHPSEVPGFSFSFYGKLPPKQCRTGTALAVQMLRLSALAAEGQVQFWSRNYDPTSRVVKKNFFKCRIWEECPGWQSRKTLSLFPPMEIPKLQPLTWQLLTLLLLTLVVTSSL